LSAIDVPLPYATCSSPFVPVVPAAGSHPPPEHDDASPSIFNVIDNAPPSADVTVPSTTPVAAAPSIRKYVSLALTPRFTTGVVPNVAAVYRFVDPIPYTPAATYVVVPVGYTSTHTPTPTFSHFGVNVVPGPNSAAAGVDVPPPPIVIT
jgi:hypothetical protein